MSDPSETRVKQLGNPKESCRLLTASLPKMNFFLLISLISAAPFPPSQALTDLAEGAIKPSVGRALGWASLAAVAGITIGTGSLIISAKRQAAEQPRVSAAGLQ